MAVTPVELQKADPSWFFSNPQAIASIGDPCILPDGDGYFLYATKGGAGFYCWHTQSLHQWTGSYKTALAGTPWAQKKHWAPEVVKHDGKYVMVYSAAIAGSERMLPGIAFSCRPEGPFRAVEKPLLNLGFSAIDASLFFDDQPYLLFSRDCSEYRPGGIRQSHTYGVALKEDLLETGGNPVLLSRPELPWECLSKEPLWNEGGCMLKHNATYYLFCSANYFATKHYCVCCSSSPSPLGPFTKFRLPVLVSCEDQEGNVLVGGPGHNSFFWVGEELFTAYHSLVYPEKKDGLRQLCYDRAGFHADGTPYINGPTLAPQLVPLKELGRENKSRYACVCPPALNDGDIALCALSKGRVWRGTHASIRFDRPVSAEMIVIYPGDNGSEKGYLLLNSDRSMAVDLSAIGQLPGRNLVLTFCETKLWTLDLFFEKEASLSEVMIVGKAEP